MASLEKMSGKINDAIVERAERIVAGRGWEAIPDLMRRWIEAAHLKLHYEEEKKPDFEAMRQKLNTERGVIIANHPGFADIPAILLALDRSDVKIVINSGDYKRLGKMLGDTSHFLEAASDTATVRRNFEEIGKHIAAGGVVLIFPTGRWEASPNAKPPFKSGFRYILERMLAPEDMVYSFEINSTDMWSVRNERVSREIGGLGEAFLGKGANINRQKEKKVIRVDERYSTAGDWQKLLSGEGNAKGNQALAQHYYGQFERV